jgi:4-amino-4-deoxy-L-arabinose transferase-like glycosyltransferase
LLSIAAAVAIALIVGAGGYGYHRDELYFVAAGERLAWGYPDQGPVTPAIAAATDAIAPDSLTALRLPSALAIAAVVVLTGLIAREFGARARAQLIAAGSIAVGAVFLITGHLLSTATFDLLAWAALALLVVRAVRTGNDRLWLVAGAVLGLALLNKPLPAFLAVALLAGVVIAGPRELLCSPWVWAGAAVALAVWAPWLIWQAREGWPQLDVAESINEGGSVSSEPRWALLPFQVLLLSPLLVGVWVAGLWRLLRDPELRPFGFLGWTWVALAVIFSALGGKPYYLAGMFPVLVAAGAGSVDRWLDRGRAVVRRGLLAAALALSALVAITLALPVLPAEDLDPVVELNEDAGETVGWPELVETVADVRARVPGDEETAILAVNYGQAGAIDRYGPELGLPPARSGHNGYWEWGPPPDGAEHVIGIGFGANELARDLRDCRLVARIANDAGVDNEELGAPVVLCGAARRPWSELWPKFRALG